MDKQKERDKEGFFLSKIYIHNKDLLRYVKARTANKDTSDDIVHEVFLRAWKYLDGMDRYKNKAAILRVMATHEITEIAKKEEAYMLAGRMDDLPKIERDVCDIVLAMEDARELQEAIDTLKPEYSDIIHLYYMEGKTLAGAAQVLGISKNAAVKRKDRALRALRDVLAGAERRERGRYAVKARRIIAILAILGAGLIGAQLLGLQPIEAIKNILQPYLMDSGSPIQGMSPGGVVPEGYEETRDVTTIPHEDKFLDGLKMCYGAELPQPPQGYDFSTAQIIISPQGWGIVAVYRSAGGDEVVYRQTGTHKKVEEN